MATRLFRSALGLAAVAGLASMVDAGAQAQTLRQQGRWEARASRQAGRTNARTFGDFGNRGYAPGYYYGPGYYAPSYAAGPGFYSGPSYYGGSRYYSGPAYAPGGYASGPVPSAAPAYTTPRAVLGITMSETPDGVVRVSSVRPNGPADEAGIRPGDVILALDGGQVYASQDVTQRVARHNPGDTVRLDINRDGNNDTIQATLAGPTGAFVGAPPPSGFIPDTVPPSEPLPAPTTPYQVRRARRATVDPNSYNGFDAY